MQVMQVRPHLVVRVGGLNSMRVFLPVIPPSTVSGNVTCSGCAAQPLKFSLAESPNLN